MIDLIIPYYNNPEGLERTLESINKDVFYVTIIDDNSTIYLYHYPRANQVFRYNMNSGPGYARQRGIDKTNNDYIMFLDTGDIFISKEIQRELLNIVENDRYKTDIFSFPYYHKDQLTKDTDNRMHGKIYKREFLLKNGITFCEESSYMNEDIGFNRVCRWLTDIKFINLPIIKQIDEENSLTNRDNGAALYRDQTRALSLVSIHTINILKQNGANADGEINQIAISLYYWFIRTMAERPEFAQESWAGTRIFYMQFQNEIVPSNLILGNAKLKQCLEYRNKISFPINILKFANDILKYENLPDKYLTNS